MLLLSREFESVYAASLLRLSSVIDGFAGAYSIIFNTAEQKLLLKHQRKKQFSSLDEPHIAC